MVERALCQDCGKILGRTSIWNGTKRCHKCACIAKRGIPLNHGWKIGLALKGRKRPPEVGEKVSRAKMGHSVSVSTRNKIRMGHLGIPNSPEHNRKIGDAHRGERHYNWKGGPSRERDKIEMTPEYKLWRTGVFRRDDYICQFCLRRGGFLDAHHIKSFRDYPDLRMNVDNGLTLCHGHHLDLHRGERNWILNI